jgi:hypothetical protein
MAIRSVKIGISGFVITLILCGVWFVVTNQAAKISQRGWHAQEEYVASQRAVNRGGSVEAMKRLAYEGCYPKNLSRGRAPGPGFWPGGPEECVTEYMYGDGLIEPMLSFFVWPWASAVLEIVAYCAFAGLALTAASETWGWLERAQMAEQSNEAKSWGPVRVYKNGSWSLDPVAILNFLKWFRANLLLMIFGGMLLLQYLTWSAISDLRRNLPSDPPACDGYNPCTVRLTSDSVDDIGASVANHR